MTTYLTRSDSSDFDVVAEMHIWEIAGANFTVDEENLEKCPHRHNNEQGLLFTAPTDGRILSVWAGWSSAYAEGLQLTEKCNYTMATEDSSCSDSNTWTWDGGNMKKKCRWVAGNPGKRCNRIGLDSSRASDSCPLTCGTCEDPSDSPSMPTSVE